MKFDIYAPVDCEVKPLTECSDDAFKNEFLGKGLLVIPTKGEFCSPFENAIVKMIFETKHAYGFKVEDLDALIHCGLETVSLKGEPFKTNLNLEDKIKKGDKLFDVDLEMIKKANLIIETPIVFDQTNIKDFEIKNLKIGSCKKGDLIASIEYNLIPKQEPKTENELLEEIATGQFKLKTFKSKYLITAEDLMEAVGGKPNFSRVYNCMTRVRFTIKDKDIVDKDRIKHNHMVKGINWAGNELQVVIGGECFKVREEIDDILKNGGNVGKDKKANTVALTKTSLSVGQKLLSVIGGVMVPAIPVLMALGLCGALFAVLKQTHVVDTPGDDASSRPMLDVILYSMYNTALITIGVYFCYNTVKFMGGNPLLGIMIGGILCSRFLLGTGMSIGTANLDGASLPVSPTNAEYASLHFGEYITVPFYQLKGFYLFHLGDYPVLIKCYESSILPFIGSAIVYVYIDRWIRTWMPASVDICFRHPLAVMATIGIVIFTVAPITSLVEFGMLRFFQEAGNFPLGFGSALFGLLWMPLTITGTHVAVGLAVGLPVLLGHSSALWAASGAAGSGQTGATIAVALKTKNKNLRSTAWAAVIAAYFGGISEPMLYGVNLPKVTPFVCGLIASFITGWMYGLMHIDIDFMGPGIWPLSLISFTGHLEWLYVTICMFTAYAISIGLTYIFYQERTNEFILSRRTLKKINKLARIKATQADLEKAVELQKVYLDKIKSKKSDYVTYEKYIQKSIMLENKLVLMQAKEDKQRQKFYKNAQKALLNTKMSNEAKLAAVTKYNEFTLGNKINDLQIKKDEWIAQNVDLEKGFNVVMAELEKDAKAVVNAYWLASNVNAIKVKENGVWNAIHSVQIGYGYDDAKGSGLSKPEKRELKNIKKNVNTDRIAVKA